MRFLVLFVSLSFLSACAGPVTSAPQGSRAEILQETDLQRQLVYQRYVEDQNRIFNISFPLKGANAGFCRKSGPLMGMTAWNIHSVGPNYRRSAQSLYNLKERLAVQSVAPGSPAARAGILSGDILVSINGQRIPEGQAALKTASELLKRAGFNQTRLMLERNGKAVTAMVTPINGCDYPVLLDNNSSAINAYTDGESIVISKGILRFAENDNEVALVIAHELAHAALHHVNKLQQNAAAGMIGGLAIDSLLAAAGVSSGGQFGQIGGEIGISQYSVAFEQEADYVGMYFMERAGFNAANVADFWRRMAAEGAASVSRGGSHPASPERFLAMDRTYSEIAAKKSRNQPLVPNIR